MPVCTLASAHFKSNQALAVVRLKGAYSYASDSYLTHQGIVLAGGPLGAVLYSSKDLSSRPRLAI